MNCYYSNLIEGHDTHPWDIDQALRHNFSAQPKKRALQLEAVAHIEVQKAIDEGKDDPSEPLQRHTSSGYTGSFVAVSLTRCYGLKTHTAIGRFRSDLASFEMTKLM
jgi:hypothetical protein